MTFNAESPLEVWQLLMMWGATVKNAVLHYSGSNINSECEDRVKKTLTSNEFRTNDIRGSNDLAGDAVARAKLPGDPESSGRRDLGALPFGLSHS
jgi:hypothetical protein